MKGLKEEDVALKLLHTADWHLGKKFVGFDESDALKLSRARLSVIRRVLDLARQYRVDAVLCAGDLFDDPLPDEPWWRGLLEMLTEHSTADTPVFLLPGNHDPLPRLGASASVYSADHPFRRGLPGHVHVVDDDEFVHELNEEAVLYGAPCRSRAGESDLASSLPDREPGDDRIRIGLVHGSTFDMKDHRLNFPIDPANATRRGLDYLAIGDHHSYREVPNDGGPPVVYPGAPEPTNFGEPGAGHVAMVFFARKGRRALIQREKVAHWSWRQETVRDPTSLRALLETPELKRAVLRLSVEMTIPVAELDDVEQTLSDLKGSEAAQGRVGILQLERDGLRLDTGDIEAAFGELPEVMQAAVRRLKARESEGDPALAQRALYHLYRVVQEAAQP